MRYLAPAFLALVLVASASADATAVRPAVALTASPARVDLEGSQRASVRLSNVGSERVVVDVARAGFALDLRGRPRIVSGETSRAADGWLTIRPRRFALRAGGSRSLAVAAKPPRRAEPGDHPALVLLTMRSRNRGRVAVRMRLGVVVNIRVPGRIVRKLVLGGLQVRGRVGHRVLEVLVANRGNVTEQLGQNRVSLTLTRDGRRVATLRPEARGLLPRTRGLVLFRYRGHARGGVTAAVRLWTETGGLPISRLYRLRL